MKTAFLLAVLLALSAVAVAPTASASHCNVIFDPPEACFVVDGALHDATDYVDCYLTTGPKYWVQTCV